MSLPFLTTCGKRDAFSVMTVLCTWTMFTKLSWRTSSFWTTCLVCVFMTFPRWCCKHDANRLNLSVASTFGELFLSFLTAFAEIAWYKEHVFDEFSVRKLLSFNWRKTTSPLSSLLSSSSLSSLSSESSSESCASLVMSTLLHTNMMRHWGNLFFKKLRVSLSLNKKNEEQNGIT